MSKVVIALAIAGAMSVPAFAQPAPVPQNAPAVTEAQPARPQMVKKLVCEENDNPYSHISRVCHTVMVPAQPPVSAGGDQPQAAQGDSGK